VGSEADYANVAVRASFAWLISSADHLVRLEEEGRWDGESQGFGSLEVDDQLELHGLLHRQLGGLRPFQDLVHIGGDAVKDRRKAIWGSRSNGR
jgi:hypothetical protein